MGKLIEMHKEAIDIKNAYLKLKGGVFNFKGESMEPTFTEGDRVIVRPVRAEDIRPGNIIVFARGGILACHRVMARFKRDGKFYFREKGDNTKAAGFVSEDDVIGMASYIIEQGKIKKPRLYIDREILLFGLVDIFLDPYIRISKFMKKISVLRKEESCH